MYPRVCIYIYIYIYICIRIHNIYIYIYIIHTYIHAHIQLRAHSRCRASRRVPMRCTSQHATCRMPLGPAITRTVSDPLAQWTNFSTIGPEASHAPYLVSNRSNPKPGHPTGRTWIRPKIPQHVLYSQSAENKHYLAQDKGSPSKGAFLNNRLLSYTDLHLSDKINGMCI